MFISASLMNKPAEVYFASSSMVSSLLVPNPPSRNRRKVWLLLGCAVIDLLGSSRTMVVLWLVHGREAHHYLSHCFEKEEGRN